MLNRLLKTLSHASRGMNGKSSRISLFALSVARGSESNSETVSRRAGNRPKRSTSDENP